MSKVVDDFLVVEYRQADYLEKDTFSALVEFAPNAKDGVCQALAQKWIKQKLIERTDSGKRQSSEERMSQIEPDDVFFEAIEIFDGFKGQHHLRTQIGARHYGLICNRNPALCSYTSGADNNETLAATLTSTQNACYMLCFCFQAGTTMASHAIAAYRSSGKFMGVGRHVYWFDPNYGEYKIGVSDFKNWWLADFFRDKYSLENVAAVSGQYEVIPYALPPD